MSASFFTKLPPSHNAIKKNREKKAIALKVQPDGMIIIKKG
jgi:hypothetical protein